MRGVCRASPCLSSAVKDLDTIIEIGGFILARKAAEHRPEVGSGEFGGAVATQNGQKPSIVIGLDVWKSNEVTAMKVKIEYCVP
jgi:hypothetical protein